MNQNNILLEAEAFSEAYPSDEEILAARGELWKMGILTWKLGVTQKIIYDFFHSKTDKTIVVNASRRIGKTHGLFVMALEQCVKFPGSIVKFIQPNTTMLIKNVMDEVFIPVLADCPLELVPTFKEKHNAFYFPNGSKIQLAGTDNKNYDKIRGGSCHLAVIDEAGFCDDLSHIIKYILGPTTLKTGGRIILGSTTPPTPDHEFIKYMEAAEASGRLIRKTIWDAVEEGKMAPVGPSTITQAMVDAEIQNHESDGGVNSDSFRTEFLCEVISNGEMAVLPEFTKEVQDETIIEWVRPAFADNYEGMDIGFIDMTGILFGYYDYDNGVAVIEDELLFRGQEVTAKIVGPAIKKKEEELWTNKYTGELQPPYMRWSDNNNPIFLNELAQNEYQIYFNATEKHKKAEYITKLKTWVKERRIIIHPRCTNLIAHMKGATWNKDKKDFIRNKIGKHHYDLVAALLYLIRNIEETRNPYPRGYKYAKLGNPADVHHRPNSDSEIPERFQHFKKQFTPKSSFGQKSKAIDPEVTYLKKKK